MAHQSSTPITTFMNNKSSTKDQNEIAEMLAEFCLAGGNSFRSAASPQMRDLFVKAVNFGARRQLCLDEGFKMPSRYTIRRRAYDMSDQIMNENRSFCRVFLKMEQQLQLIMATGVRCICHMLNTVCKRTFAPYKTNKQLLNQHDLTEQEKELVLEAKNILTSVKKVVVFVRNHNWLRKNIETLPSDEVETRWLSKLKMVEDILRILDRLNELKTGENRSKMTQEFLENLRVVTRNKEELMNIVAFFQLFHKNVLYFQSGNAVTLSYVWPRIIELLRDLRALLSIQSFQDSQILRAIVQSGLKCLQRKIDGGFLCDLHKIAFFLNPRRKLLNGVSEFDKISIHECVRSEIRKIKRKMSVTADELALFDQSMGGIDMVFDEDAFLSDSQKGSERTAESDEVDMYLSSSFDKDAKGCESIGEFWAKNEKILPVLSKVAKQMLALPASSAGAERAFSILRNVVDENRFRLEPENISKLMLAHSLRNL